MAFYSESIYLDLKKDLHGMHYKDLSKDQESKEEGTYSKVEQKIADADLGVRAYLFFEEKDMVKQDITNVTLYLKSLVSKKKIENFPFNDVVTRVTIVLHKYLEQPSLLDNLVEFILSEIIEAVRLYIKNYFENYKKNESIDVIHPEFNQIAMIVYILTKVRGSKNVRKYMGHDVADLEPIIFFLFSTEDRIPWETKFFMLSWLSVVLLMPFDLKRFDFEIVGQYYAKRFSAKMFDKIEMLILDYLKCSLKGSNRIGQAVSVSISVLFRRNEMREFSIFKDLIFWGLDEIANPENVNNIFYKTNIYIAIKSTIKDSKREFSDAIYQEIFAKIDQIKNLPKEMPDPSNLRYENLRFLFVLVEKLLRPNAERPIYRTAKKQLLEKLQSQTNQVPMITNTALEDVISEDNRAKDFSRNAQPQNTEMIEESENSEYLPVIEYLMDIVLDALKDPDSTIRYLAAKNLALISHKLPESLSDELLNAALDLLEENSENSMHGVCLTIGEFCRKGILGPHYLQKIVPILKRSLMFEEYQANYSTGFIVRDAACYISWTFAKAFDAEIMNSYIKDFAVTLLLVALFDKTGNCRRAAAASFQENVGRQGYFPHGIEIISEMDFFSVGFKNNSYLKIAPFVAQFNNYTIPFIEHLSHVKIYHIEKEMRNISCKTLGLISLFDVEFVVGNIIPTLLTECVNKNLQKRHGSLLAIACILLSYSGNTKVMSEKEKANENIFKKSLSINERKLTKSGQYMKEFLLRFDSIKLQNYIGKISLEQIEVIINLPRTIIQLGFLKGLGGQVTRIALMYLVFGISLSKIELSHETIEYYFFMIEECLRTTIEDIHDSAIEAFREFARVYLEPKPEVYEKYLEVFLKRIETEVIKDIKKSFSKGVSCFGANIVSRKTDRTFDVLISNSKISKAISMNDPEIRKNCIYSTVKLILTISKNSQSIALFKKVFDMLGLTVNDYSIDKRGDIGSTIREESIDSLLELWIFMADLEDNNSLKVFWINEFIEKQIGLVLTQVFEPNDMLRLKGGFILQYLVKNIFSKIPDFESKKDIFNIFNDKTLRDKFQIYQDKYFENYDVSLIDNKRFLSYSMNLDFIFFWNIPRCSFEHTYHLILQPRLNYFIMKGLVLSVASSNEILCNCAFDNLKAGIDANPEIQLLTLNNIYKLAQYFKNKEKFFVACMKTVQLMLKNDICDIGSSQEIFKNLVAEIKQHCIKSTSIQKVGLLADCRGNSHLLAHF
jgi:hypothetical protein